MLDLGDWMKIGIPKALLYYRYSRLWELFFRNLGCEVVLSGDTDKAIVQSGCKLAQDECCLPLKLYLGHVASLIGRCDSIFVPRYVRFSKNEELCARFAGLYDTADNTFEKARLIGFSQSSGRLLAEALCYVKMGRQLGKSAASSFAAYLKARKGQTRFDRERRAEQERTLGEGGLKVLVCGQPYLSHDPFVSGPILRQLREQGATVLFSDLCEPTLCKERSKEISRRLYWAMNREAIGAVALLKHRISGVILLTAFPCGADSLVNEMVLRRVKGLPMIQLMLDEQEGEAGMQTRVESFMDMLKERKAHG